MDLQHLKTDELEYEFTIRGIQAADEKAIHRLEKEIADENAGIVITPSDLNRITRNTVMQEMKECEIKLREIMDGAIDAVKAADDDMSSIVQSRIIHLKGRVNRLKAAVPEHNGVDRLVSRIKKAESTCRIARDSLGSGEQASGIHEDLFGTDPIEILDEDQMDYGDNEKKESESRGAIPKVTSQPKVDFKVISKQEGSKPSRWFGSLSNLFTSNQDAQDDIVPITKKSTTLPSELQRTSSQLQLPNQYNQSTRHQQQFFQHQQQPRLQQQYSQSQRHQEQDQPYYHQSQPQKRQQAQITYEPNVRNVWSNNYNVPASSRTTSQPRIDSAAFTTQETQHDGQASLAGGHRIRQWPLRFSGSPTGIDIDDFLFRVERQAQLNGVSEAALVIGIGDLLTERAAQWYWTNQRKGGAQNWTELRQAFIRRYAPRGDLDFEIRAKMENRKQGVTEKFADFCQDIEALSVRLTRRMPEDELVELMRRNMQMHLRKAMWRQSIRSVDDLIGQCDEFEHLCEEEEKQNRVYQRRTMRVHEIEEGGHFEHYNDRSPQYWDEQLPKQLVEAVQIQSMPTQENVAICWNCKDIGHTYTQCTLPQQKIFCYSCGKEGVLRAQCTNSKCPGNLRKDTRLAGASYPTAPVPQLLKRTQPPPPPVSNPFSRSNQM